MKKIFFIVVALLCLMPIAAPAKAWTIIPATPEPETTVQKPAVVKVTVHPVVKNRAVPVRVIRPLPVLRTLYRFPTR